MLKLDQSIFVLTNDMVPIHMIDNGYYFICPLPKRYKKTIKSYIELYAEVIKIKREINLLAKEETGPFVNIMLEYQDRNEKQKKELKEMMLIERIHIDERGLYAAQAGADVNSGDIYFDSKAELSCDCSILKLEPLFEENKAFQCHNVDYYWQALLCRELTVRYFNFLNKNLNLTKKEPFF